MHSLLRGQQESRRRALLAGLLILGMSATPDASAQKATVEVHARAEEGGAPVQFALVRLVRADSSPLPFDSPPQGITNTDGRYRFDGVAPGRYRVQLLRIVPNELDVLHEDFLKTHCFVPVAVAGVGEVGLRFRPLRTRRNFLDILGTTWLDSATYLARRLELEYVDFDESRGTVRVHFADVPVAGGTLRMPVGGTFAMRPSRTNPTRRTEGKFTLTYSGFEEAPGDVATAN